MRKEKQSKSEEKKTEKEKKEEQERKHQEELLDEAVEESFPASDPPSVFRPRKKSTK